MSTANNDVADMAAEIAEIEREIVRTERAGPPLADRIAAAVGKLEAAEQHFMRHGPLGRVGATPGEIWEADRMTLAGGLMAIDRERIIDAETARVRRVFEAAGGFGLSAADKRELLAGLRAQLRQLHARRELDLRAQEVDGELAAAEDRDAAAFLSSDDELRELASRRAA